MYPFCSFSVTFRCSFHSFHQGSSLYSVYSLCLWRRLVLCPRNSYFPFCYKVLSVPNPLLPSCLLLLVQLQDLIGLHRFKKKKSLIIRRKSQAWVLLSGSAHALQQGVGCTSTPWRSTLWTGAGTSPFLQQVKLLPLPALEDISSQMRSLIWLSMAQENQ